MGTTFGKNKVRFPSQLCGKQRISTQFLIKIHSASVSSRVLLLPPTPKSKTNRSKTCLAISRRISSRNFLTGITTMMLQRFLRSTTSLPPSPSSSQSRLRAISRSMSRLPFQIPASGRRISPALISPSFVDPRTLYTPETKTIDITIFEERRGAAVPLSIKFNYVPSLSSVPIHEVADGRNLCIEDFYCCLWFDGDEALPSIGVRETLFSLPQEGLPRR